MTAGATSAPQPPAEAVVKELDNHGDTVNAVGFSADGTMAATVRTGLRVPVENKSWAGH